MPTTAARCCAATRPPLSLLPRHRRGKLPSDVDSCTAAARRQPQLLIEWYNTNPGQLAEFKFHVDFATPANSTYTGPIVISGDRLRSPRALRAGARHDDAAG